MAQQEWDMMRVRWSALGERRILLLKLFRTAGYGDKKKQIDLVGFVVCKYVIDMHSLFSASKEKYVFHAPTS